MPHRRRLLPLLVLGVVRCSGGGEGTTPGFTSAQPTGEGPTSFTEPAAPTTGDAGTTGDTGTTEPPAPGTTADPATTAAETTSTTEPAGPACGDGALDPGEICDDGNRSDDDRCLSDCSAGDGLLVLVGRGDSPAAIATYVPGPGWTHAVADIGIRDAALERTPDGAVAVARRASAVAAEDDELMTARWTLAEPELLAGFAAVGDFGFAADAPALAGVDGGVTLAFLGTDFKHYSALAGGGAWGPFTAVPAGDGVTQAFGPGGASAAAGAAGVFVVYGGDDGKVYYAEKSAPEAAWMPSLQAPPPSVVPEVRPAALVDPAGDLVIAYVRAQDGVIGVTRRKAGSNTWTLEAIVDPQAITGSAIALQRGDAGGYVLAWRGFDTEGIYCAVGTAHDAWDPPLVVEVPDAPTGPPVLTAGLVGADAELLFVAGGELHWARVAGGAVLEVAVVPEVDGATSVAAVRVGLGP
jgi:cysteine-rich repeat protein